MQALWTEFLRADNKMKGPKTANSLELSHALAAGVKVNSAPSVSSVEDNLTPNTSALLTMLSAILVERKVTISVFVAQVKLSNALRRKRNKVSSWGR